MYFFYLTYRFAGPVSRTFKSRYDLTRFVSCGHIVEAGFIAGMHLRCFHGHYITCFRGPDKSDVYIQRHAKYTMRIAGKSKCTIGAGEDNTAMHYAEAIKHIFSNGIVQFAVTLPVFIYYNAHPFAEIVFVQHGGQHFVCVAHF